MSKSRDAEEEMRARISKANQAFAALRNPCRAKNISTNTNVLSTLFSGAESWKMLKTISHKLKVFKNRCLRRILSIFWPNAISNFELHRTLSTQPITEEVLLEMD